MPQQENKYNKKRLRSSYISLITSITIVLFVIGILGIVLINSNIILKNIQENFAISVYLKNNAKDSHIKKVEKLINIFPEVKSTNFISKKQAALNFKNELGEDFTSFLEYNPLENSIDISLHSDFVNTKNLTELEKKLNKFDIISDIKYNKDLVPKISKNIKKINFWGAIISALLLIMSIFLINSSVKLSIYSQRFVIKTMQLIGAKNSYIRKPFLAKGVLLGILSSFLAIILLGFMVYYLREKMNILPSNTNYDYMIILVLIIFAIGILIPYISTFSVVNKFLRRNIDSLHNF